jgi:protein O-mannosyl-transferase
MRVRPENAEPAEDARRRRRVQGGTTRARTQTAAKPIHPARWRALLLVAGGAAAYANSLTAPFVFDDHGSIADNLFIRHLWPLTTALSAPVQSAVAGRPVVSLSLAINYALGGLNPVGFHAWNLGVHLLCGLLIYGIIRRTLSAGEANPSSPSNLAFACALVWLIHPLNTEVIDYAIQRTESMMGLFYLLTLYAAMRTMSAGGPAWGWSAAAIGSCALGMATKESMVTAPVMVLLYDATFWTGSIRRALRARWHVYLGLFATWLILAALIWSGPRSHSAGFSSGVTPWMYLLNQPAMLVQYLKLAFWPHGLVLDYGEPRAVAWQAALPYGLVILALLAATGAAWRKRPALAFLGTWFFVTLAPASSIVPVATEVGAERRMYLPLMAIVVLVVVGGRLLIARLAAAADSRRRSRSEAVVLAAACCVLAAFTLQRNAEYHDRTGIWQTVLERRPHGRAHYNLGIEWREQGNRPEAIRHYQLALTDEPAAHYAVGFELDADGQRDAAIRHYREYIRLRPDDANVVRAYVLLGRALKTEGQLEAASEAFRQAVERQPANVDGWAGLSEIFLKQERFDEAVQAHRQYVRLQPDDANAHSGLGIALVGRNLESEAVHEFARAVELEPNDPGKHYNLGNALASTGRLDEAMRQYRQGLALAPANVSLHNSLGLVLAALGQSDEALAQFQLSMKLDPTNDQTRKDFAAAFSRQVASAAQKDFGR